ncbi:TRAM, LAG1 and CLN8 (TLC) lipid-sensing domain containing protein [Thalictrum thalictroides]|uniref:TRAM, LAG1 and CLN8 (TLC) lipid-sensing domain containing protein n=1 Tax=Thalictrum thalictroides TaxID=46969 RepID=A0A7J6WQQ4_THATH|nr:TRAM, LAG1 and CLN8 (TLC) lipid-sensing domain containing protein [Thalictrum thalictroides]
MENFPEIPWTLSAEAAFFLQRCQETENREALFRLGMIEYFSHGRVELGRAFLARAVCLGHIAASYVLGIILLCTDKQSILEGMELLRSIQRFKMVSRERTKTILAKMWKNHFILPERSICSDPMCSKNTQIRNNGWNLGDGNIEEEIDCDACKCDKELQLFCNILRGL